ncbi:MAG: hypothetical protein Q9211_003898 [Gyalolechia sp. 1 TL-2023]
MRGPAVMGHRIASLPYPTVQPGCVACSLRLRHAFLSHLLLLSGGNFLDSPLTDWQNPMGLTTSPASIEMPDQNGNGLGSKKMSTLASTQESVDFILRPPNAAMPAIVAATSQRRAAWTFGEITARDESDKTRSGTSNVAARRATTHPHSTLSEKRQG